MKSVNSWVYCWNIKTILFCSSSSMSVNYELIQEISEKYLRTLIRWLELLQPGLVRLSCRQWWQNFIKNGLQDIKKDWNNKERKWKEKYWQESKTCSQQTILGTVAEVDQGRFSNIFYFFYCYIYPRSWFLASGVTKLASCLFTLWFLSSAPSSPSMWPDWRGRWWSTSWRRTSPHLSCCWPLGLVWQSQQLLSTHW